MKIIKDELLKIIDILSDDQLMLLIEFVNQIDKDHVINEEAFNYVIFNYNKTLEGLSKR